ncbi:MAG TPA: tetratricopeptide repeat protein [Solirubrobacterales bacterium]
MDPNPQDMPDVMGKHDRLGDAITVALVLVTLFGALIAWRQATAHFEHDEATVRAEEWTVLASAHRTRASQTEQLQLDRRRLVRRNSMNAKEAVGRAIFGRGDPALLALQARHWRGQARRVALGSHRLAREGAAEMREIQAGAADAFPDIRPGLGTAAPCTAGPEPHPEASISVKSPRDPPPTSHHSAELQREAFRMEGRRAAAAETAVRAEEQFTHYAASLALIAVSLFFFGYALTKYGYRFRKAFAALAVLLTTFSAFLAVEAALDAPPKPEPEAAAAFADGKVALMRGDLPTALDDFACATRLNPHFPEAFLERSQAFDQLGLPRDASVLNESLENRANLRKALNHARRARQLDPENPRALQQIATALFVYGVIEHNRRNLLQALELHRRVEEAMPENPIPALNATTTLLALGKPWRESYQQAKRLMSESSDPFAYVGGALTDLEFLRISRLRDGLAATVKEAKEQMVAAGMASALEGSDSDTPTDRGATEASGVHLEITPAAAQVTFSARGLRIGRDQVFAAVYHRERLGWQEIQPLSQLVDPVPVAGGYQTVLWSTSPTSCLVGGHYKVELFINGRLANVASASGATVDLPHLVRRNLPGMNLYLCHPGKAWHRIPRRAAGLLEGFEHQGHSGREGIVVFDVSSSPAGSSGRVASTLLEHFSPPLPGGAEKAGRVRGSTLIGNLTTPSMTAYTYANGEMILVTTTTPIGRRLVIAVFGPPTLFTPQNGSTRPVGPSLLESLLTYDSVPSGG